MFTKRFLHFLMQHMKNTYNSLQIKQLYASYEIHNLFDHSLKATNAKLSRERSEVTKCIGVQVSQLIYVWLAPPLILAANFSLDHWRQVVVTHHIGGLSL